MSLRPEPIQPVPEETMRVARAAFPHGNVDMRMRDELASISTDEAFAHMSLPTGSPPRRRGGRR